MAIAGDDLLYKLEAGQDLMTTKSCNLTSKYVHGSYTDRYCEPCPPDAPFSGGFKSKECYTCDWLKDNNSLAYQKLCLK